jgi:RimJ/RimL family protein N-acetyltransferase
MSLESLATPPERVPPTPPIVMIPAKSEPPTRHYQLFPCNPIMLPMSEQILPGMYKRLHDEGIFDMFYHDFPDLTFGGFMQTLSNPNDRLAIVCEVEGDAIIDTAGIGLLTDIRVTPLVKRGLGNFLTFRKYWDYRESNRIGAALLDAWFSELDVVVGTTPELNTAAIKFERRMGFIIDAHIPLYASYRGKTCAMVCMHQLRKDWLVNRERLLNGQQGT